MSVTKNSWYVKILSLERLMEDKKGKIGHQSNTGLSISFAIFIT